MIGIVVVVIVVAVAAAVVDGNLPFLLYDRFIEVRITEVKAKLHSLENKHRFKPWEQKS